MLRMYAKYWIANDKNAYDDGDDEDDDGCRRETNLYIYDKLLSIGTE